MTQWTDILFEEFFHTLHAFFIFYFRKRILYRVYRIKIGKIHLSGRAARLVLIDHMLFDRCSMKNNIPFFLGQLPERHIRPHTEFPCYILHQRPHQCLPRTYRPFFDR